MVSNDEQLPPTTPPKEDGAVFTAELSTPATSLGEVVDVTMPAQPARNPALLLT